MFEYTYGEKLPDEQLLSNRKKLVETFANSYDVKKNRLWNCLKVECNCYEFATARKLNIPNSVMFYMERQNELYSTTFENICKYIDELEPWEYIDAYIFDDSFSWLFAVTHEDLKCLFVEL